MRKCIINYLKKKNINIKDKKIVVIGGNGVLGKSLFKILEYLEADVYISSRNPNDNLFIDFLNPNIEAAI